MSRLLATDEISSLYERSELETGLFVVRQRYAPKASDCLWTNLDRVVYGPVLSRRLGRSLGINFFPREKICSFNCPYCDCGLTRYPRLASPDIMADAVLPLETLVTELWSGLRAAREAGRPIDYITVCGNGEATLHPDFAAISREVRAASAEMFPGTPLAILTNSSRLSDAETRSELMRHDVCFLKLDAGDERTFRRVCRANRSSSVPHLASDDFVDIVSRTAEMSAGSGVILSTAVVDSTCGRWSNLASLRGPYLEVLGRVKPVAIHLHNIDYPSPEPTIRRLPPDEMLDLARTIVRGTGCVVYVLEAFRSLREVAQIRDPSYSPQRGVDESI